MNNKVHILAMTQNKGGKNLVKSGKKCADTALTFLYELQRRDPN